MRIPKRNAGLITKALKLGIFAKGPAHWVEVHRERKNGVFSRAVQSKAGKIGGKVSGRANKEQGRGIFKPGAASAGGKSVAPDVRSKCAKALWADSVWREMMRWKISEGLKQSKKVVGRPRKSGKPDSHIRSN